MPENPNVLKSLNEFKSYLVELFIGVSDTREQEIYRQVVVCSDLMIYSNEVADTNGKNWIHLTEAVNETCKKIKTKNRVYAYTKK